MTDNKTGIIIQARMSSKRLPGKSLYNLAGCPMLGYLLESLKHVKAAHRLVVATSGDRSDDALAEYVISQGIECFRGDLLDVYGRFRDAIRHYGFDCFVRINGDSPLLDYRLVERALALYESSEVDIVTNVWPRSFPKGQSVEAVRSATFIEADTVVDDPEDREHVTRYFYRNDNIYRIANFTSSGRFGGLQLSVDETHDIEVIEKMLRKMDKPHWAYDYVTLMDLQEQIISQG